MLFTKTLTTLLVSAALATFASAHVADSSLVARAGAFKAKPAAVAKALQLCKAGKSKRDLSSRSLYARNLYDLDARDLYHLYGRDLDSSAHFSRDLHARDRYALYDRGLYSRAPWPPSPPPNFSPVAMGELKGEREPMGLWTFGLTTCVGVGITGTPKDSKSNSRFLVHIPATETFAASNIASLATAVKAAGLTNMKGWVSIGNTASQTPSDFTADDKQLSDHVAALIATGVTQIIGKAPKVVSRPMKPALDHILPHGTMWIDNHNNVAIDGATVTQ